MRGDSTVQGEGCGLPGLELTLSLCVSLTCLSFRRMLGNAWVLLQMARVRVCLFAVVSRQAMWVMWLIFHLIKQTKSELTLKNILALVSPMEPRYLLEQCIQMNIFYCRQIIPSPEQLSLAPACHNQSVAHIRVLFSGCWGGGPATFHLARFLFTRLTHHLLSVEGWWGVQPMAPRTLLGTHLARGTALLPCWLGRTQVSLAGLSFGGVAGCCTLGSAQKDEIASTSQMLGAPNAHGPLRC